MLRRGALRLLHPQRRRGLYGASAPAGEKQGQRGSPIHDCRNHEPGPAQQFLPERTQPCDFHLLFKGLSRSLDVSSLDLLTRSPDGSATLGASLSRAQRPLVSVPASFQFSRTSRRHIGSSGQHLADDSPGSPGGDQPNSSEASPGSSAESAAAAAAVAATAGSTGALLSHRPARRKLAEAKQASAGIPRAVEPQTATTGDASPGEPSSSSASRGGMEAGGSESTDMASEEEGRMGEEEREEAERVLAAAQDRVEHAILGRSELEDRQVVEAEEAGLAATDEALQSLSPALEAVAAGPWLPAEEDRQRIQTQLLRVLEGDGWRVTQPVLRIWQGERDGLALTRGLDVGSAQAVLLILFRVKAFEKEHGPPPPWISQDP